MTLTFFRCFQVESWICFISYCAFLLQDTQGPLVSLMMAYIFNAMTNLAIDVRLMAFKFFDLVVQFYPSSFSLNAEKVCSYFSLPIWMLIAFHPLCVCIFKDSFEYFLIVCIFECFLNVCILSKLVCQFILILLHFFLLANQK